MHEALYASYNEGLLSDWTLYNSSEGGHVPSMSGRVISGSSDRLGPIRKATSRSEKEGGNYLGMNNRGNTYRLKDSLTLQQKEALINWTVNSLVSGLPGQRV